MMRKRLFRKGERVKIRPGMKKLWGYRETGPFTVRASAGWNSIGIPLYLLEELAPSRFSEDWFEKEGKL